MEYWWNFSNGMEYWKSGIVFEYLFNIPEYYSNIGKSKILRKDQENGNWVIFGNNEVRRTKTQKLLFLWDYILKATTNMDCTKEKDYLKRSTPGLV